MKERNPSSKLNILLVLTGGTICSFANEKGERSPDAERANTLIVERFRESDSPYAKESVTSFESRKPLDILSENMTVKHWNTLTKALRSYDYSKYQGVIILHGTDTLAYTSSLLSILMAGTSIPVFLVSSQLPLYMNGANGNINFRTAVELIAMGIAPNVYVPYRNSPDGDGKETVYLHYGAHLLQCPNNSDDFFSKDMIPLTEGTLPHTYGTKRDKMLLYDCEGLKASVLRISPYTGIDYRNFSLRGVSAVLHGTYHSCTVAVDPYGTEGDPSKRISPNSITYLQRRCDSAKKKIPLFIEPCNKEAYGYETTGKALRNGALSIHGLTSEMAYAKLLIGCSMDLSGDSLTEFIFDEINREFIG